MPSQPQGLHIDRFMSGLFTNRAATSTPFRYSYGRSILFHDALIDGLNVEITPANTLARRPGFPKLNAANALNGVEVPTGFFAAILNGILYNFIDTTQNVYTFTSSTLTSIYTKTTTAQTRYQQVGNVLFFSDGATNKKVSIDTQGGIVVTDAGLVAPTAAPTIPSLNLYDATNQWTHAWVPGAVYANTTGTAQQFYLMAPTGEIFWAVVPGGTTRSSGTVPPNWSSAYQSFGAVVVDGTMSWTNCLAPSSWAANTVYATKTFALNTVLNTLNTVQSIATSGSGSFANWTAAGTAYGCVNSSGHTGNSNTLKVTGLGLGVPAGATVKGVQITVFRGANRSSAVSDVTVQLLKAGVAAGSNKALAGFWPQIAWDSYVIPQSGGIKTSYGSNTDLWGTTLTPTDVNNAGFGVQFVAQQASTRTTSFGYTADASNNNVIADVRVFYTVGASDITGTAYQQIVTDSNGNLQAVKTAGTSGGAAPAWNTAIGGNTTDNTVTWVNIGTANQLPCLFSRTYAFGYHSSGAISHLSTLSPTLTVQAPIIGNNVNIQGLGSGDTQVDRCDLYRTPDGGGLLLYDTSTPNVNGSTSWSIFDTALDSDLNFLLIGPVAHANDPPPTGATNLTYFMGRLWAVVGNLLYFSAGPDCVNGDGSQAWPPANVFTFSGPINGLAPTSQGLVVLTPNEMSVVLGGPQTATFWVQPLLRNFGVLSQNCVAQEGDDIVVYTSQSQLFAISPSGKNELGFNVAPTLAANFNPSSSYLAIHRNGQDQGLFLSDGSTKIIRYNMNAESWDTLASPVNGFGPIASIDTALGARSLVSVATNFIVRRDPATFADSGSAYSAYAVVGSIVLSEPGEPVAVVKSLVLTSANVGADLVIAVLPNEVSGSFSTIPFTAADPYQLAASSTINMKRYDWKGVQTPLAQLVKHVQVKITLPATDTVKNEIYTLGILQ
jgi:hypothetical protein